MQRYSPFLRASSLAAVALLLAVSSVSAQNASPAAQPVPRSAATQTYPDELVAAGRTRFAANCGFCHGPEATGGSSGPDLTRSAVVAEDERGDRIGALLRTGRVEAGMPAFTALADTDVAAIVAFIHDQKARAESVAGGRRSVEPADLMTGNERAGRRYFAAACASCHSGSRDLSGVASRYEGLDLLRRMLYPRGEFAATATVTARDGTAVTGTVVYRDEFTVAVTTAAGEYRSWLVDRVQLEIDDPLQAHVDQLARYTDATMHDVFAYLLTLR